MNKFTARLAARVQTGRTRRYVMLGTAVLAVGAMVALPTAAQAYAKLGYNWANGNLRVYVATTSGNYRTAIGQAATNISATDVNLTLTNTGGPAFTAAQTNEGATGYEGHTDQIHIGSRTTSAHSFLNTHYLAGKPVAQLKVVWLHELGHGLGLDHVSGVKHVMYKSASTAYGAGVRNLTADEVSGLNSIY